jgi:hypothetical protein
MSTLEVDSGKGAPPSDPNHDGHDDGEFVPHLPPPSIRPFIMSIGLMFLAYGIVYLPDGTPGFVLLGLGVIIFAVGLAGWIRDDIRHAREANKHGGYH